MNDTELARMLVAAELSCGQWCRVDRDDLIELIKELQESRAAESVV